MIKASRKDRQTAVAILTETFESNRSVNYIIKQDEKKLKRLKSLMEYVVDYCFLYGEVLLTDDRRGCAVAVLPHLRKPKMKTFFLELKLAMALGLKNANKAIVREGQVRFMHPSSPFYHLWFIGVKKEDQKKGIGAMLLQEIIKEADARDLPIYLETSNLKNLAWYEKFGFTVFHDLNLEFHLYFLFKPRRLLC